MADISIRPFAEGDIPALAALLGALGYPTSVEQMRARMTSIARHPDHATFVAVADGRVVGLTGVYVTPSYEHDGPTGRITAAVVDEALRGHGVGRRLIAAAEAWVRERGARVIALNSHNRRAEAHAFYRHLGYSETGKRFVRGL